MEAGIKSVLDTINKKFGKESVVGELIEVEKIPTGSLGLDIALGGGYGKGRILEIRGWESSGKTTLALHLVANIQASGGRVGYIDTEHALDPFYAAALGCDVDLTSDDPKLVISQPSSGEDALGIANEMIKSKQFQLIVVDSVAGLVPKALLQGDVGDQKIGIIARLMSQWTPIIAQSANTNGCTVCYISQYREKIGVMFGNPTTTTGGNALKFYATQIVEVSRVGQNKDGEEVVSNKTKVKVLKNKIAPPFKQCEFDIVFGEGISKEGELIDLASELEIIKKSGSWYSYGDTKLGQGKEAVISIMKDNPELFEEIDLKLRMELGMVQEPSKKEKTKKK